MTGFVKMVARHPDALAVDTPDEFRDVSGVFASVDMFAA
jgi:hypothetical protein